MLKKLPIGIQTFSKIREGGLCLFYIDKTKEVILFQSGYLTI